MKKVTQTKTYVPTAWLLATDKSHMVLKAVNAALGIYGGSRELWLQELNRTYESYREAFSNRLQTALAEGGYTELKANRLSARDEERDLEYLIDAAYSNIEDSSFLSGVRSPFVKSGR